ASAVAPCDPPATRGSSTGAISSAGIRGGGGSAPAVAPAGCIDGIDGSAAACGSVFTPPVGALGGGSGSAGTPGLPSPSGLTGLGAAPPTYRALNNHSAEVPAVLDSPQALNDALASPTALPTTKPPAAARKVSTAPAPSSIPPRRRIS